jgi:hypothetical protein
MKMKLHAVEMKAREPQLQTEERRARALQWIKWSSSDSPPLLLSVRAIDSDAANARTPFNKKQKSGERGNRGTSPQRFAAAAMQHRSFSPSGRARDEDETPTLNR